MPTYLVECACPGPAGQVREMWFPIITGVPDECPDCLEHYIQHYTPPAVLTDVNAAANRQDRNLARDREAYRRLRAQGLQPPQVAGSSVLETHAQTQFEVDHGRLFPDKATQAKVREGLDRAAEFKAELAHQAPKPPPRPDIAPAGERADKGRREQQAYGKRERKAARA